VINFGEPPTIENTEVSNGIYLFVGLKNSADIIRDYSVKHRG
jgi:hypothetical protein